MGKESDSFQTRDFASEIINKKRDIPKESKIPSELLLIPWIYFLGAALFLISGFLSIFFYTHFNRMLFGSFFAQNFLISGIISILLSPLLFFIGRGLKKAKKWARTGAILTSLLGFVVSAISLIQGDYLASSIRLILFGYIAGYLLFSKKVKQFFKS